jgi:teichuronic acid biosynthesis glycosyltransferase TuaC
LALALRRAGPLDLIHAHNAVPAADAVRRARLSAPLVVSVHGGDVLWTSSHVPGGDHAVRRTLAAARLVLANSRGIERISLAHGARRTRVVHLGTDLPDLADLPAPAPRPLVVTVGHLVARKRHADVLHALADLPGVDYLVIGDGPERPALEALARRLGLADRVDFAGQLDPPEALRRARRAWVFVMPSTDEAFGVAYIEAMAAAIPAIGCAGEPGPDEIGPGMILVPPSDPPALAADLDRLLRDQSARAALGAAARQNIAQNFTWTASAAATLAAYDDALR